MRKSLHIIFTAVLTAAFLISLYFLALYPKIKDSERQQRIDDKYASAYTVAEQIFAPHGIQMYSYDEYKGMQKGESDGDMDNYLPLVKPVIMPDYELGYVIQPYEIQQFEEQADALRFSEAVLFREPEEMIGKRVQIYDFILKDARLTPYYERLWTSSRNDMPFVRIVVDHGSNVVLSASIIFHHRVAGEEGNSYWAADAGGDNVINTITAIYDSKPELFTDYEAPAATPAPTPEPEETETPEPTAPDSEGEGLDVIESLSPDKTPQPTTEAEPTTSAAE